MAEDEKYYMNAQDFLRDCWRLGRAVLDSGWRPDVLIALWRGGTPVGVAVHEFLKVHGITMRHLPLKCYSYTGIDAHDDVVRFDRGSDDVFASLAPTDRVLIVDDVFDSGRTMAAMSARIGEIGCDRRLACVYYKPSRNVTALKPDFYVRVLERWIVFPHEIDGLTREEVARKDPVLAELF